MVTKVPLELIDGMPAPGAAGNVLQSNGTDWESAEASALPTPGPAGSVLISDGSAWVASDTFDWVAVPFAATVTIDFDAGINFAVGALTANAALGAPANLAGKIGRSGLIKITQDATGSRTLTFNSAFCFDGDVALSIGTTASKSTILAYTIISATKVLLTQPAKNVGGIW